MLTYYVRKRVIHIIDFNSRGDGLHIPLRGRGPHDGPRVHTPLHGHGHRVHILPHDGPRVHILPHDGPHVHNPHRPQRTKLWPNKPRKLGSVEKTVNINI